MNFFSKLALSLTLAFVVILSTSSPVFAEPAVHHSFFLELPNGSLQPIPGATVHYLTGKARVNDAGEDKTDWSVKTQCRYRVEGEERPQFDLNGAMCETTMSCLRSDYGGPMLPPTFNNSVADKVYQDVGGNSSYSFFEVSNQPRERFTDMLGRLYPAIQPRYSTNYFRGFPDAKWQGTLDNESGGVVKILNSDAEYQEFRTLLSSTNRESAFWTDRWSDPSRWEKGELFHKGVGGNILVGRVRWTLRVTPPPTTNNPPQCNGFTSYKGDWSSTEALGATSQLELTDSLTIKHSNQDADGRPDRQDLCWSANGLTNEEYATGRKVFACATTCAIVDGNHEQTEAGNEITTEDASGTQIVRIPAAQAGIAIRCESTQPNTLSGGTTATVDKYISVLPADVQERAAQNGLVFVQIAWNHRDPGDQFCSTNPYKGIESGVIWNGGNGKEILDSNCGKTAGGTNCTSRITIQTATPTLACTSIQSYGKPAADLSNLNVGDKVQFACNGQNATSYQFRLTLPDGSIKTLSQLEGGIVPIPNQGNSEQYTITQSGAHKAECRACSASGCTNWGVTACSVPFSVATPPAGIATCAGKAGTYQGTPLSQATSVPRGAYIDYKVTVNITAPTEENVIVKDVFDTNALSWDGQGADPGVTYDEDTAEITINFGKQAGVITKKYKLKTNDINSGTQFKNTATLINNGTEEAVEQVCGTTTGSIPSIGEIMCVENGKVAYLIEETGPKLLTSASHVARNSIVEYQVTISNNNYATASEGIIEDTLNVASVEYVEGSFKPASNLVSYTPATGKMRFKIPVSQPGDEELNPIVTVSYRVKVLDKPQPTVIPNSVRIVDNGQGQAEATSCKTEFIRSTQGMAVCQEKRAFDGAGNPLVSNTTAPTTVEKNKTIKYELEITATEQTTGEVTVVDSLPPNLQFESVLLDGGTPVNEPSQSSFFRAKENQVDNSTKLTFILPAFGANATPSNASSKVITINAKVKADAQPGKITNSATVTTQGVSGTSSCNHVLAVPTDGTASCSTKEMYVANGSSLGAKIADGATLNSGTEFFYQIKLNASAQTAGEVSVWDTLPGGVSLVDKGDFDAYDQNTGKLTKKVPAFTGEKILKFKVRLNDNVQSGTLTNTAFVQTLNSAGANHGQQTSCGARLVVPHYECNSSCTTNAQCESKNADYICATDQGNTCRLKLNPGSSTCQAQGFYCDSPCENNTQCQGVNSAYTCADTTNGKRCRLSANTADTSCRPTRATPTPTPTVGCNATCVTNADCSNPQHVCHENKCRLADNVTSTSCTMPGSSTAATPTPTELPVSGPEDWGTWLKAGAVVLGIGALLLLLL